MMKLHREWTVHEVAYATFHGKVAEIGTLIEEKGAQGWNYAGSWPRGYNGDVLDFYVVLMWSHASAMPPSVPQDAVESQEAIAEAHVIGTAMDAMVKVEYPSAEFPKNQVEVTSTESARAPLEWVVLYRPSNDLRTSLRAMPVGDAVSLGHLTPEGGPVPGTTVVGRFQSIPT